ncbi:hypothetical protein [Kitasatospora phosalacinea]|uniref:hypothetical protein n=1 Tax=Kitasatospora phosalacinea TaxID=2065 RepID=UPI0006913E11|nr:hypothetical protein [Kitasatospora phosalacinea]
MTISDHGHHADSRDTDTDRDTYRDTDTDRDIHRDAGRDAGTDRGTDPGRGTGPGTDPAADPRAPRTAQGPTPVPAASTDTIRMAKTAEQDHRQDRDQGRDRDRDHLRALPGTGNPTATDGATGPILPPELASRLNDRLDHAVGTFVDDPDRAVREADEALEETVRRLTDALGRRRAALRDSWHADGGGTHRETVSDPSRTEDLRLSLRAYRDLLQHLLAA